MAPTDDTFEHVSILEYTDNAAAFDRTPGDRVIASGHRRNTAVRDDDTGEFVTIATAVAIIELPRPLTDDQVTEWCNSQVGKLALAHWFEHINPETIITSGEQATTDISSTAGPASEANDTVYVLTDAEDEPIEGERYPDETQALDARAQLMANHDDGDAVTIEVKNR